MPCLVKVLKKIKLNCAIILPVFSSVLVALGAYAEIVSLQQFEKIESKPLDNISGIAKSRRHANLYWAHNGGNNEERSRIFALNEEGKNVIPTYSKFSFYGEKSEAGKHQWQGFKVLYAENIDWKDMAIDEQYIYLGDIGNKKGNRKNLVIYAISEIDPTASTQSAVVKKIPIHYQNQTKFPSDKNTYDSESLFVANENLYVISKQKKGANLYRLNNQISDKSNPLYLIDQNPEMAAVSGAAVSPDGQLLAVISDAKIWIFSKPESGDKWLSGAGHSFDLDLDQSKKLTAVTWENNSNLLLINSESDRFGFAIPQ